MGLIISILFVFMKQSEEISYRACRSATISEIFTMKSDSSIVGREYGEQWKGKKRIVGRWRKKDGLVILEIHKTGTASFEIDTLRRLQFLIPVDLKEKWPGVKENIRKSISADEDIDVLETFTATGENASQGRENALERREFIIASEFVCGSGIMIRKKD